MHLELLLEAGDDSLAELDRVPGRLTVRLGGERSGIGTIGDVDRLAVADALERLVHRLGVSQRREHSCHDEQQSSHHGPREEGAADPSTLIQSC
jgi:hypothetical protein